MIFKSILIAYDGSEMSKNAAAKAYELAHRYQAKVEAIHVLESPPIKDLDDIVQFGPSEAQEFAKEDACKLLDEAQRLLGVAHHPLITLLEGQPGPSIIEYATMIRSDLILIGQHGLNRVEEFVLGSVSRYILRYAKCPVMIVKS